MFLLCLFFVEYDFFFSLCVQFKLLKFYCLSTTLHKNNIIYKYYKFQLLINLGITVV